MKNRVLLVEGRDDQHVILSLTQHYRVPQNFIVKDQNGVQDVFRVLPVQLKGSGVERVGVIIDADVAVQSRWDALRELLRKAGYEGVPEAPDPSGTLVVQDGMPTFGAWIMPCKTLPGMLEDFVAFLVPENDRLFALAKQAVESIDVPLRLFVESHRSKANIHTWLAWQADPGTPLGLAITKKYLDADSEQARRLVAWLLRLFVD